MSDDYPDRDYPESAEYQQQSKKEKDPWDCGVYQTGSTRPPKDHTALFAILLAMVILLFGLVSFLSALRVKQFKNNLASQNNADSKGPISMFQPTTEPTEPDTTMSVSAQSEVGVDLMPAPAAVENRPEEKGLSLQEIYSNVIDSVVSITAASADGSTSTGTGVVFSGDGYLVTNCHVISGADTVTILFTDGRELDAAIVGQDRMTDLAVLKVEATDLKSAEFGDSSTLRVGDLAVAIGDPLGVTLRGTMTDGIISGINRDITVGGRTMTLIQTTAALNEGNSGGPLLNCYGQVIGINTMKIGDYVSSAGVEGLGFAIPSTTVKEIVEQLTSQGYVSGRPSLGLRCSSVPYFYQAYYHLPSGAYVTEVFSGSSAEAQGIQTGDILLSLDGKNVSGGDDVTQILYKKSIGDSLTAILYRSGKRYELTLTVEENVWN